MTAPTRIPGKTAPAAVPTAPPVGTEGVSADGEAPAPEDLTPPVPAAPKSWLRDPYMWAGMAIVTGGLLLWASRQGQPKAAVEGSSRTCGCCGGRVVYTGGRWSRQDTTGAMSGTDDVDLVGAAVDPEAVVVVEAADSGLDGLRVDVPGDLGEPLPDVGVPVPPDQHVTGLV